MLRDTRRKFVQLGIAVVTALGVSSLFEKQARSGSGNGNPEEELRLFKEEFLKASREKDKEALERMIHDDFSLVTPDGMNVNKTKVINAIISSESDFMEDFERTERKTTFNINGDTAREVADVSMKGNLIDRGDITGEYLHSATFVKGPNGWQFIGNTLTAKQSE